jgi:hypothetical protein
MTASKFTVDSYKSTNGRSGLEVLAHSEDLSISKAPQEGSLKSLGKIEGRDTFIFEPGNTGVWFYVAGGDIELLAGCEEVISVYLQSSDSVTIIAGGEFFAFKQYGYKRRSNKIRSFAKGKPVGMPASVQAAMGLIPATVEEVAVKVPELESGLAAALKAAGILED